MAQANAEKRLLFKVATRSFMDQGDDLQYLSAFPGEREVLYPPLTHLRRSLASCIPGTFNPDPALHADECFTCRARSCHVHTALVR